MTPGDIFWAYMPLLKRGGSKSHPVVLFRELEDGAIVFGGMSTPDDDFELLHVIDFGGPKYRRLQLYGLNVPTYFYWECFQCLPLKKWDVLDKTDGDDFKELLGKSRLVLGANKQ